MASGTKQILFDETYTGPRWTYGLKYRPLAFAQVPDGWIIFSNREDRRYPNHGTVDYPMELPAEKAQRFGMDMIKHTDG